MNAQPRFMTLDTESDFENNAEQFCRERGIPRSYLMLLLGWYEHLGKDFPLGNWRSLLAKGYKNNAPFLKGKEPLGFGKN